MADDPILTNVEDDTPPAPVVPPAVVPLAEPVAGVVPAEADDQDAIEMPGGKYVPLAALRTVRGELKSLKERAAQVEPLAQRLAQAEGQLKGYADVAEQLRRAPVAPVPVPVNEKALAFARGLDLYTQDAQGQAIPDVNKAAAILGIVGQMVAEQTDARILPMAQATARDRSLANYQWARQVKDPQGKLIPSQLIDEVWRNMPLEATANPEIAKTLVFAAAGMDRFSQTVPPPAPLGPPTVTEAVGGNPRTRPAMSDLEDKVATERGIKPEDWAKHTKGFAPGRTTILED